MSQPNQDTPPRRTSRRPDRAEAPPTAAARSADAAPPAEPAPTPVSGASPRPAPGLSPAVETGDGDDGRAMPRDAARGYRRAASEPAGGDRPASRPRTGERRRRQRADADRPADGAAARDGDGGDVALPSVIAEPAPTPLTSLADVADGLADLPARIAGRLHPKRLRLVPTIILVAVLTIGVRFADLVEAVQDPGAWAPGGESLAEPGEGDGLPAVEALASEAADEPLAEHAADGEPVPGGGADGTAADPDGEPITVAEAEPAADLPATGDETGAAGEPADPAPDAVGEPPMSFDDFDPASLTRAEVAVLHDLATRRSALEARDRRLDEREALLLVAERRVDEKLAELETLRTHIEGLIGELSDARDTQFQGLVQIYEAMRPSDAAAIFNGLEMEVIISVLERMNERKSAPILANMDPGRARAVTAELALRQGMELEIPDLD